MKTRSELIEALINHKLADLEGNDLALRDFVIEVLCDGFTGYPERDTDELLDLYNDLEVL